MGCTSTHELGPIIGGQATYGLSAEQLVIVNGCAERIRVAYRDETQRLFAIGKDLKEAKAHLRYGRFGAWLNAEFGWSERTAQRYMQAYKVFKDKTDTVSVLPPGAIYALSAESTPAAVREAVVTRVEEGEKPDTREIQKEVAAAKKAERAHRAEMRVVRDLSQPLPGVTARRKANIASNAASLILERLGDDRQSLLQMIRDVDPSAFVKALLMADVSAARGPINTIEVDGESLEPISVG